MATTPEGAVKKQVTALLREYKTYFFMPVQMGMGASTLDYLGCHVGRAFAIETKAPGKHPTDRQRAIILEMQTVGMKVFVVSTDEDLMVLRAWLNGLID